MFTDNPEKVANKFGELVMNLNLDLEQTGVLIARILPHLTYNRLIAIIEMAQHEKEMINDESKRWSQGGLF